MYSRYLNIVVNHFFVEWVISYGLKRRPELNHMKKFAEIWLLLHWLVHYEIVYFLLYYFLSSHIFSLKVQISDLWVPSERATPGGQSDINWSSVQEKYTLHFDIKETQSFAIHFQWEHLTLLKKSFISRDMFGLFRICCQILLAQSWVIPTSHSEEL